MESANRGAWLLQLDPAVYRERLRHLLDRHTVKEADGCWIWTGYKWSNGYGQTRLLGKIVPAHRAAFFAANGFLPEGKDICHSCDTRNCVNPDHLFAASHLENMRDMIKKGRRRQGNPNPRRGSSNPQSKRVIVGGQVFGSIREAERVFGLSHGGISYWAKSGKAQILHKD